jgi:hypothetical protein
MSQSGIISEETGVGNDIKTLTGNIGSAVGADAAFNVNVIGDTTQGVSITGTPASNLVTITVADATFLTKGVASFVAADFTVTVGAVSIEDSFVNRITTDTGMLTPSGHSFSINGGEGMDVTHAATVITVTGEDASDTNKGIASFLDADFDVLAGLVSLEDTVVKGVTTDSGAMTPVGHVFSMLGGNGMDVTHAGNTITVAGQNASTTQTGVVQYGTDTQIKEGTNNAKTVVASSLNALMADSTLTGFVSWGGAGVYYSVAGTTFTLERAGTGYVKSKLIAWAGGQDTGALTAGATYHIYIDNAGTIGSTATRTSALFEDNIVLFEAWVDPNDVVTVVKENHPYDYPVHVSNDLHDTIHVVLEGTGAVIAVAATDDLQIIGADELHDHGLETDIADSGGAAVSVNFVFTNGAGKAEWDSASTHFLSEYNNAGTMTALGAGKYGVWRVGVSKDNINAATPTYYALPGLAQYNNLTAARAAITAGMLWFPTEVSKLELANLGYIIYQESTSTIVEVIVARSILGTSLSSTSVNSAALINVDTSLFDGWLSATDTSVQTALETLDETAKDGTFHMENTADGTRRLLWNLGTIATGTDRTITMANQDVSLVPNTGTYPAAAGGTQIVTLGTIATGTWEATDVGVAHGGTGVSTLTDHGVMVGAGVGAVTSLAEASNGQLIIGSTGANPVLSTLTAGAGIGIANAAGAITISSTGSGMAWSVITNDTAGAIANGYICNNAGTRVVVTLPSTAAIGSTIQIVGLGVAGWGIAQNASEMIHIGTSTTTTGVGGKLESSATRDCVELVCTVENTEWTVTSSMGNITIT